MLEEEEEMEKTGWTAPSLAIYDITAVSARAAEAICTATHVGGWANPFVKE